MSTTLNTTLPALALTGTHPIPTLGSVITCVVSGVSDRNPTQRVWVATDSAQVWVGQDDHNVRIDAYGVEVLDVPDALSAIDRADAVAAYRLAHDEIFNELQAARDPHGFRTYRLSLAHRTCEDVAAGVRRS